MFYNITLFGSAVHIRCKHDNTLFQSMIILPEIFLLRHEIKISIRSLNLLISCRVVFTRETLKIALHTT